MTKDLIWPLWRFIIHNFFFIFIFFTLFFQQAKKDKSLVPGYKLLVEIHKASDDIIETVRETGRMKRSTQALQESANAERSKKVNDKVTKLKADLAQLKNEVDSSQK